MAPGLIGTLQLAVALAFALPAMLFGLGRLAAGDPLLGAAFVGLGLLMLALERYLTNPFDPGDVAEAATERLTREE